MYIKKSLSICYISWGGLGFIRGRNSYNYETKENYLYINSVCYGIYGIGLYINPFLLPFSVHKEIYRLEVNLRNLENEKNTKYYNNLW
jgi:hypothetical protein